VFVKPHYWMVVDDVGGAEEHRLDLRFQLAASIDARARPDGWVRAVADGSRGLWIRAFASHAVTLSVATGHTHPLQGWVSPAYGRCEPAPVAVWTARCRLPFRSVAMLWPESPMGHEPPAVLPLTDRDGRPLGLVIESRHEAVWLTGSASEPVGFGETSA
jgi:hypothetical protein